MEDADDQKSNFAIKSKILDKGKKQFRNSLLKQIRIIFNAREKVLSSFKNTLFLIKKLDKIPTCQSTP